MCPCDRQFSDRGSGRRIHLAEIQFDSAADRLGAHVGDRQYRLALVGFPYVRIQIGTLCLHGARGCVGRIVKPFGVAAERGLGVPERLDESDPFRKCHIRYFNCEISLDSNILIVLRIICINFPSYYCV